MFGSKIFDINIEDQIFSVRNIDPWSKGKNDIIPNLAELMIAYTFYVQTNIKQTNYFLSEHQHSLSNIDAVENYHPINFFLR